ncbi:MAG: phosphatase PAP2 family protein [Chloroflexota bacterium]
MPAGSQGWRLTIAAGGFLIVLACLLALGAIAQEIHEQEAIALDAVVTPFLHGIATPGLDSFMLVLTELGSTLVMVPVCVVAVAALVWAGRRRAAVFLAVAIGGSVLLNQALKLMVERPRPQLAWAEVQPEYSFPSGHAMNSLVFYVALGFIAWRIWGPRAGIVAIGAATALAVLIGTSRIYLGYHYFSDVVGGLLAGLAWLLVVVAAFVAPSWLTGSRPTGGSPGL